MVSQVGTLEELSSHYLYRERELTEGFEALHHLYPDFYDRLMAVLTGPEKANKGETFPHTLRVGHLSGLICETLDLPASMTVLIRKAGPLHDIGKMFIPDEILLKPAKLNLMEWFIMTDHTTRGWDFLNDSDSEILRLAARICLAHHERWDGYGYPSGSIQGNIPLEGQIVGLADCFDSIVSSRPYRKAFAFHDGVEEIRKQKGRQFSPLIVHAFLSREEEIREIYSEDLSAVPWNESEDSLGNWN